MFIDLEMVKDIALKLSRLEIDRIHLTSRKFKKNVLKIVSILISKVRVEVVDKGKRPVSPTSRDRGETRSTNRSLDIQFYKH